MTESQATLIAAIASAVFSFLAAIMSHHYARIAAQVLARQNTIGSDLRALSTLTYEVIALSKMAHKTRDDAAFRTKIAAAYTVSKNLDRVRREHRYTIPFIAQPIFRLTRMPFYVRHCRNDLTEERMQSLFRDATKLREQIDSALGDLFFKGIQPSRWRRLRMWWLSRKMRKDFDNTPQKLPR